MRRDLAAGSCSLAKSLFTKQIAMQHQLKQQSGFTFRACFSFLVTQRKITGGDGEEGPQGRRARHQALCGLSLGGPADTHREFVPPICSSVDHFKN